MSQDCPLNRRRKKKGIKLLKYIQVLWSRKKSKVVEIVEFGDGIFQSVGVIKIMNAFIGFVRQLMFEFPINYQY